MATKLFVGGLSLATNDEGLRKAFESYGEISQAKVITERDGGRSRGFGFVTFVRDEDAKTAMSKMNGASLEGTSIAVNEAQGKSPRKNNRGDRVDRGFSSKSMKVDNQKITPSVLSNGGSGAVNTTLSPKEYECFMTFWLAMDGWVHGATISFVLAQTVLITAYAALSSGSVYCWHKFTLILVGLALSFLGILIGESILAHYDLYWANLKEYEKDKEDKPITLLSDAKKRFTWPLNKIVISPAYLRYFPIILASLWVVFLVFWIKDIK